MFWLYSIQLIKQTGCITDVERGLLENMLYVVIAKTKYDESYNFEQAGEDEAMFDEYRKKLKVVFDNLAALIPELVLKVSFYFLVVFPSSDKNVCKCNVLLSQIFPGDKKN